MEYFYVSSLSYYLISAAVNLRRKYTLGVQGQKVWREMQHKIFVSVQGGVAEVCEETVPAGIVVEILDFDNFAANPERELSLWSPELREYWAKNHAQGGRCGNDCPCQVKRTS